VAKVFIRHQQRITQET